MPEKGEVIDSNYISSIENLNINDWTKIQMTKTLELLNGKKEDQLSFYSIEGEKVIYNINLVIKYLTHLCKKEDGTLKTWKEMMDDMQIENKKAGLSYGVSTPWIMAVQIALEYLGYDVGKIDGNSGLDTKKMIRKYQKDNNLPIDGQPRPPMISLLIDRINEKLGPKIELDEITKNFIQQGEKLYGEGIFQINQDGSLNITEKKNSLIKSKDYYGSVYKIFKEILNPGDVVVIEVEANGNKERIIVRGGYTPNDDLRFYPKHNEKYFCNSSIKFLTDIGGIDKYFLKSGGEVTVDIRNLGITMEQLKPFLDIILEEKGVSSYEDSDLLGKIDYSLFGKLPSKATKSLLGNINEKYYKELLPIQYEDGLKLYIIKVTRGEENFERYLPIMLEKKILTKNSGNAFSFYNNLGIIIKSNLKKSNDIKEYIDLCGYLYDKYSYDKKYYTCPDLLGYDIKSYFDIVKCLCEYDMMPQKPNKEYIQCFDTLLKNKMVPGVRFFMKNCFSADSSVRQNLLLELFNNKKGIELYQFLSKYPQKLENLGGKKIKEITLNTKKNGYNFCFRGILEMIKSRSDIEIPNLKRDGEQKRKKGREIIIKEYESLLKDYISLDKDKDGNEIPSNKTFDKIFFANALDHPDEDHNGAFQGEYNMFDILKNFTEDFENCSSIIDKNGNIDQSNQKMMIEKIKQYANIHQNEKILVCVEYHGGENGTSSNGWEREDRVKLANISPNIKIISNRCYFGAAYSNENFDAGNYIYSIQSPVSGFSNNTSGSAAIVNWLRKGYKKGLGFHELEIYTRLHYDDSFTPLTEYMDYIDFRTGKKRRGLVGLADAGIGNERDDIA